MTQQELQRYWQYQQMRRQQLLRAYAAANAPKNSYDALKTVDGSDWYLNYIEYDARNIDPAKANGYFKAAPAVGYGMCTGVRKGDYVLRQLDWYYNTEAEFVIRMKKCPEKGVLYDSIGVTATSPKLPVDKVMRLVQTGAYDEYFDLLPYETVDGVNEKGVYAQSNVVEKNDVVNIDINPGAREECCCSIMLVRYILDRVSDIGDGESAEDNGSLGELLDSLHLYGIDPKFMKYNTHIMVADAKGNTKIIEFREDGYDITLFPVMTNFRTNGDFTVNMLGAPIWESIEPNGQGVERWSIGNMFVRTGSDELSSFRTLRNSLNFTNAYLSSWEHDTGAEYPEHIKQWFTDNLSGDLSAGGLSVMDAWNYHFSAEFPSEHPDRKELFDRSLSASWDDFKSRTRGNPNTWHTTHSCIYDLKNLSCNIQSQEGFRPDGTPRGCSWNVTFDGNVIAVRETN